MYNAGTLHVSSVHPSSLHAGSHDVSSRSAGSRRTSMHSTRLHNAASLSAGSRGVDSRNEGGMLGARTLHDSRHSDDVRVSVDVGLGSSCNHDGCDVGANSSTATSRYSASLNCACLNGSSPNALGCSVPCKGALAAGMLNNGGSGQARFLVSLPRADRLLPGNCGLSDSHDHGCNANNPHDDVSLKDRVSDGISKGGGTRSIKKSHIDILDSNIVAPVGSMLCIDVLGSGVLTCTMRAFWF